VDVPERGRAGRMLVAPALLLLLAALVAGAAVLGSLGSAAPRPHVSRGSLPSLGSAVVAAPGVSGAPAVSGPLHAPGGPFLYDSAGRVVFLHGVNVVYKHAPFEVYPDPGKPWNFDAHDASLIARLGFDVVRLGMTWRGLEPGTAPPNDPAICKRGPPGDPKQFSAPVLDSYLARLKETVDLLGRFHVYTILDMHQDVYNELFDGEGAPNWAVCTDGVRSVDPPGRWSRNYATAAAGIAYDHFWTNDVVGNLQGQFDMIWGKVASYFRNDRWVAGYDPFNEPFSNALVRSGDEQFDAELECFYTGTAHVGTLLHHGPPIRCGSAIPKTGVIPVIERNDPSHLVFVEPDNHASRGYPSFLGPMDFPRLVYNVHVYCGARSPKTGNPTDLSACRRQELRALHRRAEDRPEMHSPAQPRGPAWIMSEFGATSDPSLLSGILKRADGLLVGWMYWSWKFYADPTGSSAEALVGARGRLRATALELARVYPEAIAGIPLSMSYAPKTGVFRLTYRASPSTRGPTVVMVPPQVRQQGYCAEATGAAVVSAPKSTLVQVVAEHATARTTVRVTISPGACAP
jgi:endoglycosylceramidase